MLSSSVVVRRELYSSNLEIDRNNVYATQYQNRVHNGQRSQNTNLSSSVVVRRELRTTRRPSAVACGRWRLELYRRIRKPRGW